MRRFATGVTVVTVRDGNRIHGMTANSFTSVSLTPTLVLICVLNSSVTFEMVSRAGHYCVNLLAASQREWAERFAKQIPSPTDPFHDIVYHSEVTGAPVLDDCIMHMDCRVVGTYPGGDHTIFVGEVLAQGYGHLETADPLLWVDGKYKSMSQ